MIVVGVIVAHLVAAALAPPLVRLLGVRAFPLLAIVPAAGTGYAAARLPAVLAGEVPEVSATWVPSLGLEVALRMDLLSWLLTMVVTGVGTLVLLYCGHYFVRSAEPDLGIFAGALVAFAGVMVGVVTADDLLVLYIFWEATTILSYVLIGYHTTSPASIAAAKQALIVTTAGGLAMLVGIIVIGTTQDTYRLSEIVAAPASGTAMTVGVVLVLAGAVTKSALVPFHFWLPGAMAAPTPVSAYLHAASMVKAGVYLVARLAPAHADLPVWRVLVLVLGGATMLLGAYRSLRQRDLKLLLAYGTVSQLGLLVVLVGHGTRATMLAGLALLLAHALFKAALFLTVGALDHAYGTRDLSRLTGLLRREPVLAGAAIAAAASMAGLPPLLGFAAKEAALTALWEGTGVLDRAALVVVALGSILTFAYSARFVWGAFGDRPGVAPLPRQHPPRPLVIAVPVVLAAGGLVLGPLSALLEPVLDGYAATVPGAHASVHLGLWHGLSAPLLLSVTIWVLGSLMFRGRAVIALWQGALSFAPDAGRGYQRIAHGLDRMALEITGWLNRGSTPRQLGTILAVLVLAVVAPLTAVTWPQEVRPWDDAAQVVIALVVVASAIGATRARRRLRAVFLVGSTGYGMSLLFLLHGGPDLALTQALVETVSLIAFVLVLRRLSGRFPDEARSPGRRRLRALLGVLVGLAVMAIALSASTVRSEPPAAEGLPQRALEYGGGSNIVNVILVDVRAWDTMGEISVVLAAATGIASLVFVRRGLLSRARRRLRRPRRARLATHAVAPDGEYRWIAGAEVMDPNRRSTIFEVVTRLIFHTLVLWSVYLLFAGHDAPGGGFSAGLVAGLALALRYLAGQRYELAIAAPVMPGLLLGSGLSIAALSAGLPLLFGSPALRTWILDVHVPGLGDLHLVTSLLFDIGVYLVVIGLMFDILRTLGSALDEQIEAEDEAADDRGRAPSGWAP